MKALFHLLMVAFVVSLTLGCGSDSGPTVEQGEPAPYEVEHNEPDGTDSGGSDTSTP